MGIRKEIKAVILQHDPRDGGNNTVNAIEKLLNRTKVPKKPHLIVRSGSFESFGVTEEESMKMLRDATNALAKVLAYEAINAADGRYGK